MKRFHCVIVKIPGMWKHWDLPTYNQQLYSKSLKFYFFFLMSSWNSRTPDCAAAIWLAVSLFVLTYNSGTFWCISGLTTNKVAESAKCLCIFPKIPYFLCTLYVNHLHISNFHPFSPFQSHFFQVETEQSMFFHYYGFTVRSVKISLRTSRLPMSFDGL